MQQLLKQETALLKYEQLRDYAASKGGVLLSERYVNSTTHLQYRCARGHEWASAPAQMWSKKSWCRACFNEDNSLRRVQSRDHVGELQAIAAERGGSLESATYLGSAEKLFFKCADGHAWDARPNDIRRGTWCPSCFGKTEGLVRKYLECVFGTSMPSKRLPCLIDTHGKQRVLDGYSAELKFAFEYHGEQHFGHVKFFHSDKSLEQQQDRDAFVRDACAAQGVVLLEIPTLPDGYDQATFLAHMDTVLATTPGLPAHAPGGLESFLSTPERLSKLTEMVVLAKEKGGECLSTKYLGLSSKMTWRCAEGHEWQAIPKTVKLGHWCPYCGGNRRLTPLDDLHAHAQEKGGVCHEVTYKNVDAPVSFTCGHGHSFVSTAGSVFNTKAWCPVCGGNRVHEPLSRLAALAAAKGGALLSTEYVNQLAPVRVQCAKGHQWETTASALVHRGSWCKQCACIKNGSKTHFLPAHGVRRHNYATEARA